MNKNTINQYEYIYKWNVKSFFFAAYQIKTNKFDINVKLIG